MKKYRQIQLLGALYLLTYVAMLYFSTGVHMGFKLDDHQLPGYVLCGLLLAGLVGSGFVKTLQWQRTFSVGLLGISFIMLGIIWLNVIPNNEAFIYFIFFVYLLPFWQLLETGDFIWSSRHK